jgi:hypothetical protein
VAAGRGRRSRRFIGYLGYFRVDGQADLCESYAEAALLRGDKVLRHPLAGRIAHIAWWRQMAALRDQLRRAAGKNGR